VPVSRPFRAWSEQLAVAHAPLSHIELMQSLAELHMESAAQAPHGPPQSRSDSAPFRRLSLHVGMRHCPS